jgi:hypothetical protein
MDFIIGQIDYVEVILAQLLQTADVFMADFVALAIGRPLELAGSDFGDIVGQPGAYGVLHADRFQHGNLSLCA